MTAHGRSDQPDDGDADRTTTTDVRIPPGPDAPDADSGIPDDAAPGPPLPTSFSQVRRGYDPTEVDDAIARATARIQELERTVGEQQERLVSALKRPMLHELDDADLLVIASEETTHLVRAAKARARAVEDAAASEASAVRQAIQAEREETLATAKQTLEDAKQRASSIGSEAEERAATRVAEAERRAARMTDDAQARSEKMIADAENRAATLVADAEGRVTTIVSDAQQQASTIVSAAEDRYEEIRKVITSHREQLRAELDDQREELGQVVESLKVLRQEFSTSFRQVTETMDQVRNLSGMLWRFGEPVQRAEGYVEQVFDQLGEASLPPRTPGQEHAHEDRVGSPPGRSGSPGGPASRPGPEAVSEGDRDEADDDEDERV